MPSSLSTSRNINSNSNYNGPRGDVDNNHHYGSTASAAPSAAATTSGLTTTSYHVDRPPLDKYERFEAWLRENGAVFDMVRFVTYAVATFISFGLCPHFR